MKNDDEGPAAYVRKVRGDTQKYAKELLEENERLRARVVSLDAAVAQRDDELIAARSNLERCLEQRRRLQAQLTNFEAENRLYVERYVNVERQNANLANLYVASYRLHSTLEREDVLRAIEEIISNLIGCEEFGIFELEPTTGELLLISSCGVEPRQLERLPIERGLIGHTARSGETYRATRNPPCPALPEEQHLTACVPLSLDGRVVGAIGIFRLLEQKQGSLEAIDSELLALLATHAGTALYCSRLHTLASGAMAAG